MVTSRWHGSVSYVKTASRQRVRETHTCPLDWPTMTTYSVYQGRRRGRVSDRLMWRRGDNAQVFNDDYNGVTMCSHAACGYPCYGPRPVDPLLPVPMLPVGKKQASGGVKRPPGGPAGSGGAVRKSGRMAGSPKAQPFFPKSLLPAFMYVPKILHACLLIVNRDNGQTCDRLSAVFTQECLPGDHGADWSGRNNSGQQASLRLPLCKHVLYVLPDQMVRRAAGFRCLYASACGRPRPAGTGPNISCQLKH